MSTWAERGWRGHGIALAALGAAVLGRSAFGAPRTGGLGSIEMQLLVFLALTDEEVFATEPAKDVDERGYGETRESLTVALACDHDDVSQAVFWLIRRGLVVRPKAADEERLVPTSDGLAVVEEWLERVAPLFARWPPDVPGADDATG